MRWGVVPDADGALDALVQAQHPIEGVWTLSYLMAHWAARQAHLPRQAGCCCACACPMACAWCCCTTGARVLAPAAGNRAGFAGARGGAHAQIPADNRIIERDTRPQVLSMHPAPDLRASLQNQGLPLLPAVAPRKAAGMLAEVLALAGQRAPGQLAAADQPTPPGPACAPGAQGGHGGRAADWAGCFGAAGPGFARGAEQSRARVQQATNMEAQAQAIREDLARRQINVPLLRLALEVQRQELDQGLDPAQPLWMLGQMLQAHPRPSWCAPNKPCAPRPAPVRASGRRGHARGTGQRGPAGGMAVRDPPRRWPAAAPASGRFEALGQSVAAWPQWQVKIDPVRLESATAIGGGQNATTDAAASAWRWCLGCTADQCRGDALMKRLWPVVFPLVRPAVLTLAGVLAAQLVAVLVLWGVRHFLYPAGNRPRLRNRPHGQLEEARAEQADVQNHLRQYQQMVAAGWWVASRAPWVEDLLRILQQQGFAGQVSFTLAAPEVNGTAPRRPSPRARAAPCAGTAVCTGARNRGAACAGATAIAPCPRLACGRLRVRATHARGPFGALPCQLSAH